MTARTCLAWSPCRLDTPDWLIHAGECYMTRGFEVYLLLFIYIFLKLLFTKTINNRKKKQLKTVQHASSSLKRNGLQLTQQKENIQNKWVDSVQ